MQLTEARSRDLLRTHGVYVKSACDRCGKIFGAVRYTWRDEPGEWCSRFCRDGVDRKAGVRRKKTSRQLVAASRAGRLCRNPKCTRGEDGTPGSLAHLRADALYCDDACRMAAQRSPNRRNHPSNRQCLCGFKANKIGALALPHQPSERLAQIACNRNLKSIRQTETIGSAGTGIAGHEKRMRRSRL